MTTRKELTEALRARYRSATFGDRIKILDEFVALTGYHRKHAIRVPGEQAAGARAVPLRNRLYDEAVRQALTMLWEAADRVCGKRLKALIPTLVDAMERHGHLDLDPVIRTKVLQVSVATIDRALALARQHIDGQRKRRKGVGAAIRRSIPVRTFADWRDPPPGFFEIDMVEHCGGVKTDGDFVHTLTLTDIASGWTECVSMRMRNQMLVIEALDKVAIDLPFAMLGVDSDNDSAFMSQTVFDYCKGLGLEQTRSRAYKKNDQAITLQACHAREIMQEAFARYGTPEIVNTDQGSQFTADEFTDAVLAKGCKLSMDGRGSWRDHVFVERIWRSVKYERVYLKAYDSASAARADIADYFAWYNSARAHSNPQRITPDQVYLNLLPKLAEAA